jgi:valyl-tRNA synthetase
MDDTLSESVIDTFIDLYNKNLIYRGVRMVNWDPQALTAVSDEEVIYKEVRSKLYYIRYKVEGESEFVTIATTRPETILGDPLFACILKMIVTKYFMEKKCLYRLSTGPFQS